MSKYICSICDFVYDEEKESKKFDDLFDDWVCPICESKKSYFNEVKEKKTGSSIVEDETDKTINHYREKSRELLSGICSANKVCDGNMDRLCQGQKFNKPIGFGGAGQGLTFNENYQALKKYKLKMRIVKKHAEPDLSFEIFDKKITMPLLVASISGMKINFNDAISEIDFQRGMIEGAIKFGTIGMSGNTPSFPENPGVEIIKENNGFGIPVFKPQSQDELKKLFKNAERSDCIAIGVDLDGCGSTNWALKGMPVYRKSVEELKELVDLTKKPVIFKGIMSLEDAKACHDAGAKGIVISNHGGRVMDSGQGTVEVIKEISKELKGKLTIIADGGIRTGYDMLIMLALGCDAVMIGREIARMSLTGGSDAVNKYLEHIKKEFRSAMYMTGCDNVDEISEKIIIKN